MLDIDWSQLNKVLKDKFNRVNGIFAVNKQAGETSHDIVDTVRKILGTRKVGHAGALDPFATGLMLILVGRYTKKAEFLLMQDKSYNAKILLGIGTDSHDIDGKITDVDTQFTLDETELTKTLEKLNSGYLQKVPVFSSVKVNGMKLREIARSSEKFKLIENGTSPKVEFILSTSAPGKFKSFSENNVLTIDLPVKQVEVNIEVKKIEKVNTDDIQAPAFTEVHREFFSLDISVSCSKGTYIRQLASDIGAMLGTHGVLYSLIRTRIGEVTLDQAIEAKDISL